MLLADTDRAAQWLRQFNVVHREIARQMLRQLELVSASDFERQIQTAIEQIIADTGNENLALFSVIEPPSKWNFDGERRVPGSSSDRVRHLNENIRRIYGSRVLANPTVNSMRAERIRNIIMVDDFVGTGGRIIDYWKREVNSSVKSWVSYGWTRLWVVAYSALGDGLSRIIATIRKLRPESVRLVLPQRRSCEFLTQPMVDLAYAYASHAGRKHIPLGYGEGGSTIVFEHGCPNNSPVILWSDIGKFKPLFPGRGIPTDLRPCFGVTDPSRHAETLWSSGQYYLALALLSAATKKKAPITDWELFLALGISSRTKWNDALIAKRLSLPIEAVSKARSRAYILDLLNPQTHELTRFGVEFLKRIRLSSRTTRRPVKKKYRKIDELYYPDSCEGMAKY